MYPLILCLLSFYQQQTHATSALHHAQAQTASLVYQHKGEDYLLNLIDTPGHVGACSSLLSLQHTLCLCFTVPVATAPASSVFLCEQTLHMSLPGSVMLALQILDKRHAAFRQIRRKDRLV